MLQNVCHKWFQRYTSDTHKVSYKRSYSSNTKMLTVFPNRNSYEILQCIDGCYSGMCLESKDQQSDGADSPK